MIWWFDAFIFIFCSNLFEYVLWLVPKFLDRVDVEVLLASQSGTQTPPKSVVDEGGM